MSQRRNVNSASKDEPKKKNGEGSVYWDARRKKYAASIYDINKKRQRAYFDSDGEGHKWIGLQIEARQKGLGTFVRDPKCSLEKFLLDWLGTKKDLSANGFRNYQNVICLRINPYIGRTKLKSLNPRLIESFLQKLIHEVGYKGGTVRGVIRTLNAAFNDGVRSGEIPFNPMNRVVKPRLEINPSPRIPKFDVAKLMTEASKNPTDYARFIVGVQIGLRPGEVAGLKWKDLDIVSGRLHIVRQIQRVKGKGLVECRPKTLRKATKPLLDNQVSILAALLNAQYRDKDQSEVENEFIFKNSVGRPMDSSYDRKWFRNLCDRAGVPRYARYQMRKAAFTELSQHADLPTVMAYSGHTSVKTLIDSYIDPDESAVRSALERCYQHPQQIRS